ncbi:MAG: type I DNA topoisomerase [Thermoflexus hugenholtzii]|jgi:DNA topoisomerase-1|uniref:type I DNA topoisomerase n=1 Tax=Thermoflexus TaxID=1495649 RepID=UPI001C78E6BC|nr:MULTISPECIES: type I DNA topoisomerase [Thermoflexus]QWK10952.1 MAG: type I DNA topoisomerase [Thermoflexus hugenholtzii]
MAEKGTRLVIVESPAKARTVGRILGRGFTVKASIGHVRDLLKSQLAVDVENNFKPTYRVPKEKQAVVRELRQAVKEAEEVYLATDPDREGEAIAWHLTEVADIPPSKLRRVVFHEITEPAIREAFAHPRGIDMQLVHAQQARRILDRLVGYKLSPLLWEKVRGRLSAGRVQSVALRLIVEREREIQAFVPEEYWTIAVELSKLDDERAFRARLVRYLGLEPDLKNEEQVRPLVAELEDALYVVVNVKKGERRRRPAAPFTTSTMQQEASRRLGFTARRTMAVAQQLYEGLPLGEEGSVGLITYMRTDSTNVSPLAQEEARRFIAQAYGEHLLPPEPPVYKTRARIAQEAHEAIRPTSVFRTPESVKPYLDRDQYRLYELIWKRFIASQMAPAILDTMTVEIVAVPRALIADGEIPLEALENPRYLFRATGSAIRFPGFLVVYEEAREEDVKPEEEEEGGGLLPPLEPNERLRLWRVLPEQHFTQPPPRYTEASLIKTLEELGIGRPSTYAPILSTLFQRGYVERVDKRLVPTPLGITVTDLLVQHFPDIMDVNFTARMEEDLDRIAAGEEDWVEVLRRFYGPFEQRLQEALARIQKVSLDHEVLDEQCPECGAPLQIRYGRFGKFVGCTRFPECRYTRPFFNKLGVPCPQCGGELLEKKSKRGRTFYGCSNWPTCNFTTWKRPLTVRCPHCGGLLVQEDRENARCLKCEAVVPLAELEPEEAGEEA